MPVLNGDDIAKINEFAVAHGKEWQILDDFGGGIRLKFKDNKAFVYHKTNGSFDSCGRWEWDYKDGKKDEEVEEVLEEKEEEDEEVKEEESE